MDNKLEILRQIVNESDSIVFFGGAGVSTESGIPDFRSKDGLYNQKWRYPPETIISRSFFESMPDEFFRFYREKLLISGVKPSRAHYALAKLERTGKLKALITQNIDGLHQDAGSKNVYELHGSVRRNYCMHCGKFFSDADIREMDLIPRCDACGGIIKPDVVLYEEALDRNILIKSVEAVRSCDTLIVGGTSLTVYPAAGLIDYFSGKELVIINKSNTGFDSMATLTISGSIGEALSYAAQDIPNSFSGEE